MNTAPSERVPLGHRTMFRLLAKTGQHSAIDTWEEAGCLEVEDGYNELVMPSHRDGWKRRSVGRGRSGLGSKTDQYELSERAFDNLPCLFKRLYFAQLTLPGNEDAPTVVHAVWGGRHRDSTYILPKEQEDYYLDNRPQGITPSQVNTMIHRTKIMHDACADGADGSECPEPSNAETLATNAYCAALVNDAKQDATAAVMLAEFIAFAPPIAEGYEGVFGIFGQNGEAILRDFVQSFEGDRCGFAGTIALDSDVEDDYDIYARRIRP